MVADAAPAAPAYRCRTGDRIARFVFERLSNLFRNRIGYRLGGVALTAGVPVLYGVATMIAAIAWLYFIGTLRRNRV